MSFAGIFALNQRNPLKTLAYYSNARTEGELRQVGYVGEVGGN